LSPPSIQASEFNHVNAALILTPYSWAVSTLEGQFSSRQTEPTPQRAIHTDRPALLTVATKLREIDGDACKVQERSDPLSVGRAILRVVTSDARFQYLRWVHSWPGGQVARSSDSSAAEADVGPGGGARDAAKDSPHLGHVPASFIVCSSSVVPGWT
jgi:hypothetical protein